MNKTILAILLAAVCLIPRQSQSQSGGCHSASAESTQGLAWVTALVTATRPSTVTLKNNLGITATSASQVSLVTTDSICTAAAEARAAEMQIPYDSVAIYVYKAGNAYVTDEHVGTAMPDRRGWRAMHVFDLSYNFLAIAGR